MGLPIPYLWPVQGKYKPGKRIIWNTPWRKKFAWLPVTLMRDQKVWWKEYYVRTGIDVMLGVTVTKKGDFFDVLGTIEENKMDITVILYLIWAHFIADFVFQNDKTAIGKSSNNLILLKHVATYSLLFLPLGSRDCNKQVLE